MAIITNAVNTTDESARFAPTEALMVRKVVLTNVEHNVSDRQGTLDGNAPLATIDFTAEALDGRRVQGVTVIYMGQQAPDFKTDELFVIVGRPVDGRFETLGFFRQASGAAPAA